MKTIFGKIVWSDESCSLKSFVERFTLLQLVKVEEGIYSEVDDTTISAKEVPIYTTQNELKSC